MIFILNVVNYEESWEKTKKNDSKVKRKEKTW